MREILLASCFVIVPGLAAAQVVEVGATIASACLGSDGSACGTGKHPMAGLHASWWIADRVEVGARVSRVGLPPLQGMAAFPTTIRFDVTDRSREFVSVLFAYHFRGSSAVRPFVGLGSGGYARSERVRCDPAGCGGAAGLPPEGSRRTWQSDAIVVAGLSGHVRRRWVVRGGVLCHRFANDENSTIELFAGIGYRFGV